MTGLELGAAQAAFGLGQSIYGAIQSRRDRRERNRLLDSSPQYEIPQEYLQNMSEAEMLAFQGLPEAQKQEYLDNIRRSTQFTLAQSSSRSGSMMALPMIQRQLDDAYRNMLSQDSAARMSNIQFAQQARMNVAAQREKQFDINEMQPYNNRLTAKVDDLSYARGILGVGIQNIMGGAKTAFLSSLGNQGSDNQGFDNQRVGLDNKVKSDIDKKKYGFSDWTERIGLSNEVAVKGGDNRLLPQNQWGTYKVRSRTKTEPPILKRGDSFKNIMGRNPFEK